MQLSKEQQAPCYTKSQKVLVIAPAGSGKTRVLISRIGYLISDCNVSPYEVMSFSFTRKSASEIVTRLEKEIGQQAHKIRAGTQHGISLKLLQQYGELVGLRPDKVTVYGSWEEWFLLKEVAKEMGYHDGYKWKKVKAGEVEMALNLFYNTGQINPDAEKENSIVKAFFARCRENNALTYGTILTTFLKLIPEIAQYLNLCHLLVDEIQDMSPLQWEIINSLCKHTCASLFVIGDQRQAIFGFRGGDSEYLTRNKHLFDIYNLKDNYRSSANIVEAANNLISHNDINMGEPMMAIRDYGQVVDHVDNMDSDRIVGLASFYKDKNTAILSRNHWPLEKLSKLLTEANIKHEYIGKKTAMTRSEEFRRFHAFLNLIVNTFDNFSFLLIKDYLGLTPEEYRTIRMTAVEQSKSHFQIWQELYSQDSPYSCIFNNNLDLNMGFLYLIQYAATGASPFSEPGWNPDCHNIVKFVFQWIVDHPAGTIAQYLNWLATFDTQDEIKEETEGLQLLTMHAAKGLEFHTVIIIGLNEGVFPSDKSIKSNELSQEVNLCYVALTRAEDQLILTSRPPKKSKKGKLSQLPSRFIEYSQQKPNNLQTKLI